MLAFPVPSAVASKPCDDEAIEALVRYALCRRRGEQALRPAALTGFRLEICGPAEDRIWRHKPDRTIAFCETTTSMAGGAHELGDGHDDADAQACRLPTADDVSAELLLHAHRRELRGPKTLECRKCGDRWAAPLLPSHDEGPSPRRLMVTATCPSGAASAPYLAAIGGEFVEDEGDRRRAFLVQRNVVPRYVDARRIGVRIGSQQVIEQAA